MGSTNLGNSACDVRQMFAIRREAARAHCMRPKPRNRLLATLPYEALSRIQPHLKPMSLTRGTVLCEADAPLTRVYFMETGVVSLMAVFQDRTTAEMATVGREGVVGIGAILGGESVVGRHVAPMQGLALVIGISRFRSLLRESPPLHAACAAYAQAFLRQALHTAACNSVHMIEQRCARWLLMTHDRSDGDMITLTQEYLAEMLGVCRSTVTLAAGALQRGGLIRYSRGALTVLDRPGLEAVSCECYRVIRDHYEQLLPPPMSDGRCALTSHRSRGPSPGHIGARTSKAV
jgi:CRP-like cAMP-binding protein